MSEVRQQVKRKRIWLHHFLIFLVALLIFIPSVFSAKTVVHEYADTVVFDDGGAKFTFHDEPKYLKDENNLWADINADFQEIQEGFFDWKSTFNYFKLKVKNDGTFQFQHEGDTIAAKLVGVGFFNKQTKDYFVETDIAFGEPIVDANTITWSLPHGVTYTIYSHNGKFRDVLVLPQSIKNYFRNNRPQGWTLDNSWIALIYQFEKDLVSSMDVNGVTDVQEFESTESIHFMQNGRKVHSIIKSDAYNTALDHYDWNSYYDNVWFKLKKLRNNLYLEAVPVSSLWSADGNLVFNATLTFDVNFSSDDAWESNAGTVNINSVALPLTILAWGAGIRFQGTKIPQGSTISEATLTTTGGQNCAIGLSRCESEIYGEDEDDTNTFQSVSNNISNRTQTTASVTWLETTAFTPNAMYVTTDHNVTAIVQEIVDRGSFSENTLTFLYDVTHIGRGSGYSINTFDSSFPVPHLEVFFEGIQDVSFSLLYPDSGCIQGKGDTNADGACDRVWFDYNGSGQSTETKIEPDGQDYSSELPIWSIDNQSTLPNNLNLSIDLNENTPANVELKASNRLPIIWVWFSNCLNGIEFSCIVLDDSNKFIAEVPFSQKTQDYNIWLWLDVTSGGTFGVHERDANFYSYGVS